MSHFMSPLYSTYSLSSRCIFQSKWHLRSEQRPKTHLHGNTTTHIGNRFPRYIPVKHSVFDVQHWNLSFPDWLDAVFVYRVDSCGIIPIDVLSLCCEYFPYEFNCLSDLKNEGPFADQIIINDSNEYLFNSLDLHQTAITGNARCGLWYIVSLWGRQYCPQCRRRYCAQKRQCHSIAS